MPVALRRQRKSDCFHRLSKEINCVPNIDEIAIQSLTQTVNVSLQVCASYLKGSVFFLSCI